MGFPLKTHCTTTCEKRNTNLTRRWLFDPRWPASTSWPQSVPRGCGMGRIADGKIRPLGVRNRVRQRSICERIASAIFGRVVPRKPLLARKPGPGERPLRARRQSVGPPFRGLSVPAIKRKKLNPRRPQRWHQLSPSALQSSLWAPRTLDDCFPLQPHVATVSSMLIQGSPFSTWSAFITHSKFSIGSAFFPPPSAFPSGRCKQNTLVRRGDMPSSANFPTGITAK